MNRTEEYRALLAELEQTPPELDSTVERASRRSASAPLSPRDLSVSSSDRVCLVLYVCHTPMSLAPRSL